LFRMLRKMTNGRHHEEEYRVPERGAELPVVVLKLL